MTESAKCEFCKGTGEVYCTKQKCADGCPIPEQRGHDKSWRGYYRVDCVCVWPKGRKLTATGWRVADRIEKEKQVAEMPKKVVLEIEVSVKGGEKANLGLATTAQLLEEVKTRLEMERFVQRYRVAVDERIVQSIQVDVSAALENLPGYILGYRTVDQ